MSKNLFTASEMSNLLLSAFKYGQDGDSEAYLEKVEKLFVSKLMASAETERLVGIRPQSS